MVALEEGVDGGPCLDGIRRTVLVDGHIRVGRSHCNCATLEQEIAHGPRSHVGVDFGESFLRVRLLADGRRETRMVCERETCVLRDVAQPATLADPVLSHAREKLSIKGDEQIKVTSN